MSTSIVFYVLAGSDNCPRQTHHNQVQFFSAVRLWTCVRIDLQFARCLPPKIFGQSGPKSAIPGQSSAFPDIKSAIPGQGYSYFGDLKSAIFRTNIRWSFRGPVRTCYETVQRAASYNEEKLWDKTT